MTSFPTKIKARLSTRWIYSIILLVIFGISLALRVSLPYENVFMGDWVKFLGNDPWYHMRLVENLVQHFPHRIAFDPFTLFPSGQTVPFAPFFDLLLGSVIWVIGLGNPTQHTIETVGAYFPAILGALVTIPVYFIGRELFNRNAGLLAAGLIAILPGQFFLRSMLGFTDHHIAEVLFSTIAALFLILAIKRAREREISFSQIWSRDWGNLKKPLIYALLTGMALGTYLISWSGGLFFLLIIFAYMIIQFIIDHMKGKPTDYLCIIGVPMFLIALIIVLPFSSFLTEGELVIASLTIGALAFLGLNGVSRLMAYMDIKKLYYPLALAVLGVVGIALLYVIDPSLYDAMVSRFLQVFKPSGVAQTIGEVRSMFSIDGFIGLIVLFTANIIIALTALGLLIYARIKERGSEGAITFLIIWSLIMLLAMLSQTRFAYYFAVNVALLSGYLCWRIMEWSWSYFVEMLPEPEIESDKVSHSLPQGAARVIISSFRFFVYDPKWVDKWIVPRLEMKTKQVAQPGESTTNEQSGTSPIPIKSYFGLWHGIAGISIIVFLVAFVPNIAMVPSVGTEARRPNEAWHSSLTWMREHTPDPFDDPDFYYELYERPIAGKRYNYPESAYGVMNFWDYGHWITRIARRIPTSNPFQSGARRTAEYFIAQGESTANEVLDKLGCKYVIIDYKMATLNFNTMGIWAGESEPKFSEIYERDPAEGEASSVILYYPEYYQSMNSRLFNFGGKEVVPYYSTYVISYEDIRPSIGTGYKEITGIQLFTTYEEAQEFVESQTEPNYRIVGNDPFTSPVPLEELEHYRLVHQSDPEVLTKKKVDPISYVKIFEYLP